MKSKKRIFSLFLCIFLCLFLITDVSFAQEENPNEIATVETTDETELLAGNEDAVPLISEETDESENSFISEDENVPEDEALAEDESAHEDEASAEDESASEDEASAEDESASEEETSFEDEASAENNLTFGNEIIIEEADDNENNPSVKNDEIKIEQSAAFEAPMQAARYSVSTASSTAPQPTVAPKAAASAAIPAASTANTTNATAPKSLAATRTAVTATSSANTTNAAPKSAAATRAAVSVNSSANTTNVASKSAARAAAIPAAANPTLTCTAADGRQLNYNIVLKNASVPNGATVKFAVWSVQNGQDDIVWYTAKKSGSNYIASVPIKSHKTAGSYEAHAYYQTAQGQLNGLCTGNFTVKGPSATRVTITRIDNNTGSFRVVVTNLTAPSGITKVQIPVWCSPDQSDIVWYTAVRHPNSNYWLIDTNISNHAYHMGTYQAHVYATDGNGITANVGGTTAKIGGKKGNVSAKAANSSQSTFNLSLSNATVPNGCTVKFAVWSDQNGQDDLIWYTAQKSGNIYVANVPISSHRTAGNYTVHAYYQTPQGQMNGLSAGKFNVNGISQKSISVTGIDKNAGTFRIMVNAAAPSGVKEVRVAVWSAANQNDIHWYYATRSGNSYIVDANIANHKFNVGNYNMHAYATLNSGVEAFVAGTTYNITVNQYIEASKIANGEYKIFFRSATPVNYMNMAVWSDANGQDDLVWYPALHEGGNMYSVTVYAKNHLSPGTFICHVYADNRYMGSTAFYIPIEEFGTEAERRLNTHIQNVYNTVGRDLYANYCWVKNTFTYSRRSGHIVPPDGYTREQWYAVEGFEQHSGNCYTYAAAFYELARGLGYNAQYVEGAVYGYGKWQPHGFVLIYMDGTTYICDPELEYASTRGRNLYMQPMSAPRATYRLWQ